MKQSFPIELLNVKTDAEALAVFTKNQKPWKDVLGDEPKDGRVFATLAHGMLHLWYRKEEVPTAAGPSGTP